MWIDRRTVIPDQIAVDDIDVNDSDRSKKIREVLFVAFHHSSKISLSPFPFPPSPLLPPQFSRYLSKGS
jgi:hypothetical protein